MRTWLISIALAAPIMAQACPSAPDHRDQLEALFEGVRMAPNERQAEDFSQQMWQLWTEAPDAKAQALLDRGMEKRAGFDFLGAIEALDQLVAYCPAYGRGLEPARLCAFPTPGFPGRAR